MRIEPSSLPVAWLLTAWAFLIPTAIAAQVGPPCQVTLVETQITDNGDRDGFLDTDETVQIGVSLEPLCYDGLQDWVARISTESLWVH